MKRNTLRLMVATNVALLVVGILLLAGSFVSTAKASAPVNPNSFSSFSQIQLASFSAISNVVPFTGTPQVFAGYDKFDCYANVNGQVGVQTSLFSLQTTLDGINFVTEGTFGGAVVTNSTVLTRDNIYGFATRVVISGSTSVPFTGTVNCLVLKN